MTDVPSLPDHLAVHIHTSDYLLLGGVHDSGYAATLHQLGRTIASKVILLQTTPVLAQPLADLKLEVLRFPPGLFDGHEPTFNRKGAFPTKGVHFSLSGVLECDLTNPWPAAFHGVASTPPRVFPSTSPSKFASPHVAVPLSYASAASPPHTTPSAFTPSVHPRPVSPTKTAASSSSSIPSVFVPLVNLLRKQERMGNTTPSRATIGATLKGSHPGLYAHFKEYSVEAERLGIVVLGSGQLIGTEWIRLAVRVLLVPFRTHLLIHFLCTPAESFQFDNHSIPRDPSRDCNRRTSSFPTFDFCSSTTPSSRTGSTDRVYCGLQP